MIRLALVALFSFGLAVTASPARADEASAKKHLDRAVEYYQYKRYQSAALEFERAYGQNPDPRTLFAWAQAERLAGNCRKSIALYEKFTRTDPPASDVEAATFGVQECERQLAKAREAATVEDATAKKPASRADAEEAAESPRRGDATGQGTAGDGSEREREARARARPDDGADEAGPGSNDAPPWYTDQRGALMTGGGGALVIAGFALYLSARSLAGSASEAEDDAEFDSIIGRAEARRNVAVLTILVGVPISALGILRYAQVRKERRKSLTVTPAVGPDSASILLRGTF